MNEIVKQPNTPGEVIERLIAVGDLKNLSPEDRTKYYMAVCDSVGINPLTKPFDYMTLNGKLVLYATKGATDQIRNSRKISVQVVSREKIEDVYIVTARAMTPDGRQDESTGAVSVAGLRGDQLANAYMKAETKAKRRVTLSMCGLGMLDELEAETIPNKQTHEFDPEVGHVIDRKEKLAALVEKFPIWNGHVSKYAREKFKVTKPSELTEDQFKEICKAIETSQPEPVVTLPEVEPEGEFAKTL